MLEHRHPQSELRLGEVVMLQGLIPVAIWLETCKYAGVGRHGQVKGDLVNSRSFGTLGGGHSTALYDEMVTYGTSSLLSLA